MVLEGTAHRRRDVVAWYAAALARVVGKWLVAANVVWFVAGLACLLFLLATGWDPGLGVGTVLVSGLLFGIPGFMLSGILFAIGQHFMDERLWRSGLRRGTATVHDLRPGDTDSQSATQKLTCRLEVHVVGMARISGDYSGNIGPLDALYFVEGATFVCEVSPRLPERVRVWLFAAPLADELTGRYRDFQPMPSGRS